MASSNVFTYDPKEVQIIIAGVPMSGFTDGTFVEIVRNEATWSRVTGADGYTTRGKTNDFSGTITLTLKQSSASNDILSGFMISDELTNSGIFPVIVKDNSGTSTFFAASGWIQAWPDSTYGKEINDRAWVIELANLNMFVGGNSSS